MCGQTCNNPTDVTNCNKDLWTCRWTGDLCDCGTDTSSGSVSITKWLSGSVSSLMIGDSFFYRVTVNYISWVVASSPLTVTDVLMTWYTYSWFQANCSPSWVVSLNSATPRWDQTSLSFNISSLPAIATCVIDIHVEVNTDARTIFPIWTGSFANTACVFWEI